MTTVTSTLREYVRAHAENRPGIYRMTGPGDELLYVGKSVKVRSRLLSYFTAERGEKAASSADFTPRTHTRPCCSLSSFVA